MKKQILFFSTILIIIMFSCSKYKNYNVSGKLLSDGIPVENAIVTIDGLEQYKTTSSSDGFFIIENVSNGLHKLNVEKFYTDSLFIKKSFDLDVNTDINYEELLLPNPVSLLSVTIDTSTNIATITWNKSNSEDFREYKLYSHSTSGIDETTGTLEHVATEIKDTVTAIQLDNYKRTFLRVFVMNDYGKLGGSNIINVQSMNINLCIGGDFESQNLFEEYWTITSGTVNIIDSVSYEGNSCVYMQNVIIPDPWQVEESLIEIPIYFEKDTEYELSFWYKISGIARMDHHTLYFYYFQDEENHFETNLSFELGSDFWEGEWIPDGPFKILDDTGWLNYTKTLVPTNNSPAIFIIGGQIENIKLDNLSIKVKE